MRECRVASLLCNHSNKMMKYLFQQLLIPATIISYIIPDVGISESTFCRISTLWEILKAYFSLNCNKNKLNASWKCWNSLQIGNAVFWRTICGSLFSQPYNKSESIVWFCDNNRKTIVSDGKDLIWLLVCVCGGVLVVLSIPETSNSFQRLSPFHDLDGDDSDENISEISLGRLLHSFIACHHKQYFCEHVKPLKICIC